MIVLAMIAAAMIVSATIVSATIARATFALARTCTRKHESTRLKRLTDNAQTRSGEAQAHSWPIVNSREKPCAPF